MELIQKMNENSLDDTHRRTVSLSHFAGMIVYQCMRTTLLTALEKVIPAFCGEWGDVSPKVIGRLMYEAYKQVMNPPDKIDWNYAERWRPELQYAMESWTNRSS